MLLLALRFKDSIIIFHFRIRVNMYFMLKGWKMCWVWNLKET